MRNVAAVLALLNLGCWTYSPDDEADAAKPDAGFADAGVSNDGGAANDGGTNDGGTNDGGAIDAGANDGGPRDGGFDGGCLPVLSCWSKMAALPASLEPPGLDTGLCVAPGAKVTMTTSGSAQYGIDDCNGVLTMISTDPSGRRNGGACAPKFDGSLFVGTAPVGSMLIRLGDAGWVAAGASFNAVANTTGPVRVLFNDNGWADNTGQFTFALTVCP